MKKYAVCIATIRPKEFEKWMQKWSNTFNKHEVHVYVMQDTDKKSIEPADRVHVFDHFDVGNDLMDYSYIIPKKTSSCRSYALMQAYNDGYDYYHTLDDDCYPVDGFDIFQSCEDNYVPQSCPNFNYLDVASTFGYDYHLRGYPYGIRKKRKVAAQYGVWENIADYDAITSIGNTIREEFEIKKDVVVVPKYSGFTGCLMNASVSHEYAPILYHLLMGPEIGYDRFDDIWSGLLLKKITDHLDDVILINGSCRIRHDRASNHYSNLQKELPAMPKNEALWEELMKIKLSGTTPVECYKELAHSNVLPDQTKAMHTWINNF